MCGRQAHKQTWDTFATNNYSTPFGNYSALRPNHLGINGREEKRKNTPPDPVFEIYYYSIATEAKIKYSKPMLTCRNLWGEGGCMTKEINDGMH